MGKKLDIKPGTRFGRLTVIEEVEPYIPPSGYTYRKFRCLCDCGNIIETRLNSLRYGTTQSCGCFQKERHLATITTHGFTNHPAYHIYLGMMHRCYCTSDIEYSNYGGRDITVCDEWRGHPEVFCAWADATGFKEGLSIDRIDNKGNYCPDNCRWLTQKEQQRNRRNNVEVIDTLTSKTYNSIAEAVEDTGLPRHVISCQVYKKSQTTRFITYSEIGTRKVRKVKCLETGEVFNTTADVARKYSINQRSLMLRLKATVSVFIKKLGLTFSFIEDDTSEESPFVNLLDLSAQLA